MMKKLIAYALIAVSLVMFFVLSLHHTEYLVISMAFALAGLFLLYKNGSSILVISIFFAVAAFLRFCYYNDFMGLVGAVYTEFEAEHTPERYLIYAVLAPIGIALNYVAKKDK